MKQLIRFGILTLVFGIALQQTRPLAQGDSTPDGIAKDYNTAIQPLYDQIDSLKKKADDSSVSMADAAKIVYQEDAIRKQADDLWTNTNAKIDQAFGKAPTTSTSTIQTTSSLNLNRRSVGQSQTV